MPSYCTAWNRLVLLAAAILIAERAAGGDLGAADPDALSTRTEYGITLALGGYSAGAESVFVSVLSLAPKNPAALTNLGNLHLLRGELEAALVFYNQALSSDPTDAGILLDRAVAFMLRGDDAAARAAAAAAMQRVGSREGAASLLGLPDEQSIEEPAKAEEKPYLTRDEVRELLDRAATSVPVDSIRVGDVGDSAAVRSDTISLAPTSLPTGGEPPTWRSAGPRAADASEVAAEVATVLYWKR